MTTVIVVADGGVAPDDLFAINFCRHRYVLANRKSKDVLCVWQGEAVTESMSVCGRDIDVFLK